MPELEGAKTELTRKQYVFCCELIWGNVPEDRGRAEETGLFKDKAPKLLERYPMLDKSFFDEHLKKDK
jgi:hypothetical protein